MLPAFFFWESIFKALQSYQIENMPVYEKYKHSIVCLTLTLISIDTY